MGCWMDGLLDGLLDGRVDGWVDGWVDGSMDGWMDGWKEGGYFFACLTVFDLDDYIHCAGLLFALCRAILMHARMLN